MQLWSSMFFAGFEFIVVVHFHIFGRPAALQLHWRERCCEPYCLIRGPTRELVTCTPAAVDLRILGHHARALGRVRRGPQYRLTWLVSQAATRRGAWQSQSVQEAERSNFVLKIQHQATARPTTTVRTGRTTAADTTDPTRLASLKMVETMKRRRPHTSELAATLPQISKNCRKHLT